PGEVRVRPGTAQGGEQRRGAQHVARRRELDQQDARADRVDVGAALAEPAEPAGPIALEVAAVAAMQGHRRLTGGPRTGPGTGEPTDADPVNQGASRAAGGAARWRGSPARGGRSAGALAR